MPVMPSCLLEAAWVEFRALLDERRGGEPPEFAPGHPWGCHRRRIPDRVVFEHVIGSLVHGSGLTRANRLVTCFESLEDVAGGVGKVGVDGEALAVDVDGR